MTTFKDAARFLPWALMAALALLGGAAAGQSAVEVDQMEVCLVCHDLADAMAAAVSHAPVQAGQCSACHNPHAARREKLLLERPAILCASCHRELPETLGLPVVHQPVAEGRCTLCHEAHGGDRRGLLVRAGKELCRDCHEEVESWEKQPVQHPPFAAGDCATCHEPHAGEFAGLSMRPASEACATCHEVDSGFRAAHSGYPVERADCRQCHEPHASARAGLFRENLHPPFEDGGCTTCHVQPEPEAAAPFAVAQRQDALCGDCHEDAVAAARQAPFPHVPAGGGSCSDCHNPHTADGSGLLEQPLGSLCLSCHDPGGASSKEPGRFSSHGEELGCTLCHTAHGGDRPLLMANEPVQLCGSCHSHQHSVSHPMGEETRDPRNGQPVDCRSCHGIHEAPNEKYLHRSGERDLCLGCHKELASR